MKTIVGVLLLSLLFFSCTKPRTKKKKHHHHHHCCCCCIKQTTTVKDTIAPKAPLIITYHLLTNKDSIATISKHYTAFNFKILLALNRYDSTRIHRAKSLIIPDTFVNNLLYYSPFPDSIQLLDTVHKALLVSYPLQAVAAYEKGVLVRWAPTSLGKKTTPTPTGLFFTNWKSKETKSTEDSTWILKWYFNLDNFRGVSLHEYDLPGVPASHACIRLLEEDAKWIYYWAKQWKLNKERTAIDSNGTPVIIFGTYNYNTYAPWQKLSEAGFVPSHPVDSLAKIIEPLIPRMLKHPVDSIANTKDSVLVIN